MLVGWVAGWRGMRNMYMPAGVQLTDLPLCEAESAEYGASRFGLDGNPIVFRVAKKRRRIPLGQ